MTSHWLFNRYATEVGAVVHDGSRFIEALVLSHLAGLPHHFVN